MAVTAIVEELKRMSVPAKSNAQIHQVATCSSNNDAEIGRIMAEAMNKVLANPDRNFGYDALREACGDMIKFGVIVPTKIERVALQNGASIGALLLTTDAVVGELPEKKKKQAMSDDYGD